MRDFNITKKEGEWYHAKVTDSYGNNNDVLWRAYKRRLKWKY